MDDLERSIKQVRSSQFSGRSLADLTEEYTDRLWGSSSDENMERLEELGAEIELRRSNVRKRIDQLEKKVADLQSVLVCVAVFAVLQALVSFHGREAVAAWSPVFFVVVALVMAYRAVASYRKRRKYR